MTPEIPEEQIREAIEAAAREALSEAEVEGPPVDALVVARRLGLIVARDGVGATRARLVRLGGGTPGARPAILLADDPRPERRQWAVAHEIGESRAYAVFAALGVDPAAAPAAAREAVANRLAGCLLLPRRWLAEDGVAVDWDLAELKGRYATASHELIARRMLEMPWPIIVTVADQGRVVWRRGNLPGRTPPLTPPERDAWQTAHEGGVAARCDAAELPPGLEDVRAWPVHEPAWRREILRTALADLV